jgi:hypothetical protein
VWLPAWNLLAICDGFIKDVDGASKNMHVVERIDGVSEPTEDVRRREAGVGIRNMVVQKDGMLHSHRPKLRISHIGPVNGSVQHHGPGNGHNSLDRALSVSILVMGTDAGKSHDLAEGSQMCLETLGGKGGSMVCEKGLRHNA